MSSFEKFSADDLRFLRTGLQHTGLDSFQVAQLITGFLAQRGYGVSTADAHAAVASIEAAGCTLPCLQEQLEKLALVM